MMVLAWIASPKWRTFVAYRVAEIQINTTMGEWKHVSTCDNPADVISRGFCPSKLINLDLWWSGPKWLTEDTFNWPESSDNYRKLGNIPESKENTINVLCVIDHEEFMLNKYESLTKCSRITAYCLRFINNVRNSVRIIILN